MCNFPWLKKLDNGVRSKNVLIPCHNCLGCRIDSLTLWTARCNSEFVRYKSAFVTFTYDDLHLPYMDSSLFPTLRFDDFHRYIDNVRHKIKSLPLMPSGTIRDFKYFACGEYGDLFKRPHYHVLFFGLDYQLHKSILSDSWRFGMIKSLPITNGGIRYVCDYMTKSLNGELAISEFDNKGLERPFYSNSRGLGSDFFLAHRDEICSTGCVTVGTRKIPVPSYYKNLLLDYSVDSVRSRKALQYDNYVKILEKAKKNGFDSYDSYIRQCRIENELKYHKSLVNNGKSSLNSSGFDSFYKRFDDSLVFEALNIF